MRDPNGYQETVTKTHGTGRMRGPTFGDDLDFMIKHLATADADGAEIRADLRTATIIVTLEPRPSAEIVFPMGDDFTVSHHYHVPQPQSGDLTTKHEESAMSALHRTFCGTTMEALAIIWIDNQAALRLPPNESAGKKGCGNS